MHLKLFEKAKEYLNFWNVLSGYMYDLNYVKKIQGGLRPGK